MQTLLFIIKFIKLFCDRRGTKFRRTLGLYVRPYQFLESPISVWVQDILKYGINVIAWNIHNLRHTFIGVTPVPLPDFVGYFPFPCRTIMLTEETIA
jgi:hypothetical protein